MIVTGCSFGAYHALNFAMRHPDKVTDCVCMGGAYDIKKFLDGWYSDEVYFNNPPGLPGQLHRRLALQPHSHRAGDRRVGHVLER